MNVEWMETTSSTNPPFLFIAAPSSLFRGLQQPETDSLQQAVADPDNSHYANDDVKPKL